jgi:hypothetical protein
MTVRATNSALITALFGIGVLAMGSGPNAQEAAAPPPVVVPQGGAHSDPQVKPAEPQAEAKLSPEEQMRRRFPQPAKAGFLVGLPVLDYDDITIGYVRHVVRTPEGKVLLIVNHGRFFGWGGRLVPVPIEVVAILARQIVVLEMTREDFTTAPTWSEASTKPIAPEETIRIAITRR